MRNAIQSRKPTLTAMQTRYTDHATPLYLQELVLTSPSNGNRLVGIVHLQTKSQKAPEFYEKCKYSHLAFPLLGHNSTIQSTKGKQGAADHDAHTKIPLLHCKLQHKQLTDAIINPLCGTATTFPCSTNSSYFAYLGSVVYSVWSVLVVLQAMWWSLNVSLCFSEHSRTYRTVCCSFLTQ